MKYRKFSFYNAPVSKKKKIFNKEPTINYYKSHIYHHLKYKIYTRITAAQNTYAHTKIIPLLFPPH